MVDKQQELSKEEQQHIQDCIKGSRASQEYLYNKYAKKLYHLSLSYTGDRDEAKDILQETFIKIFNNLDKFKGLNFEGWARRILANTAIDQLRKNKKMEFKRDVQIEAADEEEGNFIGHIQNMEQILGYIKRLPSGSRLVFNLFAVEGYSHKQIAQELSISEGTSKSQYNRAKSLLKEWILARENQP